ncbi:hypothetical protein IT575_11605 [bacterium]|nr:hypothetical protein [bacterium]
MNWTKAILNLDRRIIFSIVALVVAWPLISPLALPVVATPEVEAIFQGMDALPAGSHVLISADFDPASKPELQPMLDAVLQHCFAKGIKPTIMTLWPGGPALIQGSVERAAKQFNKVNGTDFVFLGYKPGNAAVMRGMVGGVQNTYANDHYNTPTSGIPIFQEVRKFADYDYFIEIAAGATVEPWLAYAVEPTKVPMGVSCTAVSAAQYYAFVQGKQIVGLAAGMKGSAEYEFLVRGSYSDALTSAGVPAGAATKGMDAQSLVHIFIVLSIIVANLAYFIERKRGPQRRSA